MATIEEQVEVLMSGAEYGDPETKVNMQKELHANALSKQKNRADLYVSIVVMIPVPLIYTLVTQLPCVNYVNFKNLGMMSHS